MIKGSAHQWHPIEHILCANKDRGVRNRQSYSISSFTSLTSSEDPALDSAQARSMQGIFCFVTSFLLHILTPTASPPDRLRSLVAHVAVH